MVTFSFVVFLADLPFRFSWSHSRRIVSAFTHTKHSLSSFVVFIVVNLFLFCFSLYLCLFVCPSLICLLLSLSLSLSYSLSLSLNLNSFLCLFQFHSSILPFCFFLLPLRVHKLLSSPDRHVSSSSSESKRCNIHFSCKM